MDDAERDYIVAMDARIAAATEGSGWVPAIVAAKLHAQLQEADPDLLDGWLHAMAVQVLRRVIGLRQHQERAAARRGAGARAFAGAAREFSGSDPDDAEAAAVRFMGMFRMSHEVDDKRTQKRVFDMTGPEHLFVAEHTYQREANRQHMLAAFHRAVAKKIGKRRTEDVLTEEQYEAMYQSIVRSPGNEAA